MKNSSSLEPNGWWLESLYAALGTWVLQCLFKWWPWIHLDLFYGKVKFGPLWETVKTMDFSETIVVYDIKAGRSSQLNEYMKLYEYQRSRSLTDLGPNLSDLIFLNFFSSITTRPIEAKCHVEPPVCRKSMDSVDSLDFYHGLSGQSAKVHWVHGQVQWDQPDWTMSMDSDKVQGVQADWTMSMDWLDKVHGLTGLCPVWFG